MISPRTATFWIAITLCSAGGALVVGRALAAADATSAESLLRAVEGNPDDARATDETRKRARAALERATRFREVGDEARARLAEGLALKLAELARDQARAARVERTSDALLRAAQDAGAQVDRERALVEEALAQGGRLRAQVAASGDAGAMSLPATSKTSPKAAPGRDGGAR